MASYTWFGGTGTWDGSTIDNWSTTAATTFTGTMTGTNTLTVSGVTGAALAIGKTVRLISGGQVGTIVGGSGSSWTLDVPGTYSSVAMGAGTLAGAAPNSADTVTFEANSGAGGTVTVNGGTCLTVTASAMPSTMAFDGGFPTSGTLYVYGNATFNATIGVINRISLSFETGVNSVLNSSHPLLFDNVSNNKVTNTLSISTSNFTCVNFINLNTGGTTTLNTNLTCDNFYLYGGVLNINAATLTATYNFSDDDAPNARSIVFTTGTLNVGTNLGFATSLTSISYYVNNGLTTFTAGTGRVVIGCVNPQTTSAFFVHNANGNLRDVLFQGTKTYVSGGNFGTSLTINGSTTAGFRVTAPLGGANHELIISSALSISVTGGTFSVVGPSVTNRAFICNEQMNVGSSITLTGTAARTLTNVDLQDIAFTYSSSLTGTSIGDCGGNTGVTVTTPTTCYAKTGATAFNYSGAMWFTASGGSITQRLPLPQDTVIFDSNTGSGVVTVDVRTLGKAVTTTGWAGSFGINLTADCIPSIYGQYTGTGSLLNPITRVRFASRANITIPANGITAVIIIDVTGFTATLSGNINNSDLVFYVHSGTFDTSTSNYSVSISNLVVDTTELSYVGVQYGDGASIVLNGSTINCTNNIYPNPIYILGASWISVSAGTSTINLVPGSTYSDIVFDGGGKAFANVTLTTVGAIRQFSITGSNTFSSFSCTTDYPFDFLLPSSSTNTFASLSLAGKKGAGIVLKPTNLATAATVAIGSTTSSSYVAFRNITKSGASSFTASNVADLGSNSGITFRVKTRVLAISNSGAGSFTVPIDFVGSNMFYAIGAGGGAGKRAPINSSGGGGSAAIGIASNLNISKGQTIYYSIGAPGAGSTTAGVTGGTGGITWANINANVTPAVGSIGVRANGGGGSSGSGTIGGSGGSATPTINNIYFAGATGGTGGGGQGGGGAAPAGFNYDTARVGGAGATSSGGGGGGGGGIAAVGGAAVTGASGRGGNGGAGTGSGGAGGAKGTTTSTAGSVGGAGAGGGGGGSVSSNGATANVGGAGGIGSEFSYTNLNGVNTTGTIGAGGAGGGGGGSDSLAQTTVTGGAGGVGSYGAGGGGGGRGNSVCGNGGDGGGGLLLFVYEASAGNFGGIIG